jgi:hypothetical protein
MEDVCIYFVVIWYIFPRFSVLYQEKSALNNVGHGNYVYEYFRVLEKPT